MTRRLDQEDLLFGEGTEPSPLFSQSSVEPASGLEIVIPVDKELLSDGNLRYRAVVSYDGTDYRGFAVQPRGRTVAGEIEAALAVIYQEPIRIGCAGRTDTGVHARGQVISFVAPPLHLPSAMERRLNRLLPPAIGIQGVWQTAKEFDARHSARYRQYVYLMEPECEKDPLWAKRAWQIPYQLDFGAMRESSYALLGQRDFRAFCKKFGDGKPTERRVHDIRMRKLGRFLEFSIWANSFCQQMVRSVVGVMVEVGRRRRPASDVQGLLISGDRLLVKYLAPPHGLYLWSVGYEEFSPTAVEEWLTSTSVMDFPLRAPDLS